MKMCQEIDSKLYMILTTDNRSSFKELIGEISNKISSIIQNVKNKHELSMDLNSTG